MYTTALWLHIHVESAVSAVTGAAYTCSQFLSLDYAGCVLMIVKFAALQR